MKTNLLLCAIFSFFVCSCSPGKLFVLEGNFNNSAGRSNDAEFSYLKALEYIDAAPYANYGLGTVYYSLGEGKAALECFEDAKKLLEALPPAEHRELRYRASYNAGVACFGQDDFSAAAALFREALKADPSRIEAKRNLELSLLSLAREKPSGAAAGQGRRETETVLFEYMRQREQKQWKSREWAAEEDFMEPDY